MLTRALASPPIITAMPWPRFALPPPTVKTADANFRDDSVAAIPRRPAISAPLRRRNGQELAEERLLSPNVSLAVNAARDLVVRQPSFADAAVTTQLQQHALRNPHVAEGLFFALLHAAGTNPTRAARRGIVFILANLDTLTRHIERRAYRSFANALQQEYSYKSRALPAHLQLIVGTCVGLGKGGRSLGPSLTGTLKKLL